MLAAKLVDRYANSNCAVVALSEGAVVVGAEIANALNCVMMFLITEGVILPGENLDLGAIDQTGGFTYNGSLAEVEIEEYVDEYHGYVEEQKREATQHISREIGRGDILDKDMLRHRVVILVSDGLADSTAVDVAVNIFKPLNIEKLIVATPVIDVDVVDSLHVIADELQILDVRSNYLGANHYYTDNTMPTREQAIEYIAKIVANWR